MNKINLLQMMVEKDKENFEGWYLLGEEYVKNDMLKEGLYAFSIALNDEGLNGLVEKALKDYFELSKENFEVEIEEEEAKPMELQKYKVIQGNRQDSIIQLEDKRPTRVTFNDVGGLEELKKTIDLKIIKPFVNPSLFSKFKKKAGGGILLYGPPGCGKTFIAKATSGEINANFYPVHITDILDPYFGGSERNLHQIFETARANKPSVMFFDEIDTIGYSRSKSNSDLMRPLVDSMLTEMESVNTSTDKLLIIGATNMPWDVDSALKRPGRFDKLVFVPPPDKEARKVIFQLKLLGKPVEENLDISLLADKTHLYSGADIENVIEVATEHVLNEIMVSNQERSIKMDDLLLAIKQTNPSTLEWINTIKNYIKYANQSGLYSDVAMYIKENL